MKKILFSSLIVALSFALFAKPVSQESAQLIAIKWYKHITSGKANDFTVKEAFAALYEGATAYYTFVFNAGGFVMVAADDAVIPVLGYSVDSRFDKNYIPLNASEWFASYEKEINHIIDSKLDNSTTVKEWDAILNENFSKSIEAVSPLCATTWDQGDPYNLLCPPPTGTHSYTGCAATAMAQIMKKWNYPNTGNGSHSYSHPNYGTLTANFGATSYQWGNMINSYYSGGTTAQKQAVATIMYHCGVSIDMDYSPSGSGTISQLVPGAFINYFKYSSTVAIKYKANFTAANWINLLKLELDGGRPMYYSGTDGSSGHAFVCDGYNNSDLFHFNWGYSGWADGYYAMGSLNPGSLSYNMDNTAVIGIKPIDNNVPVANFSADNTTPAIAAPVNFTDLSTNNPTSWSWIFDGGTPSISNIQNPSGVTFSTSGYHTITLTATNSYGSDTKVMSSYINVGGTPSAWTKQNTGFTTAYRGIDQICIVSPLIVWAKAYDGTNLSNPVKEFSKTTNGGTTWVPGTIAFTNDVNYGVANMYAVSDLIAFAAMYPTGANGGVIAKTVNGGTTWSVTASPDFSASWLNLVHFFNTNDGVCMGDPSGTDFVIYTTANGGASWTAVPAANIPNANTGEAGTVDFCDAVGNTIWFGTTAGRIFKSIDKGLHWAVSSTGFTNQTNVRFKDASIGFALLGAAPYTVKKTIDGGATWTAFTPTGYFVKMPHLDYIPGTASMWVNVSAGPGKGSSYSLTDCSSFLNIDTGSVQYTCVSFYNQATGWAGGFNASAIDGGIYKWNNTVITSIENTVIAAENSITIYPVPANDIINIAFGKTESDKATVSIYDLTGKLIKTENIRVLSNDIVQIDISREKRGLLFITVQNGNSITTKKILLIK